MICTICRTRVVAEEGRDDLGVYYKFACFHGGDGFWLLYKRCREMGDVCWHGRCLL